MKFSKLALIAVCLSCIVQFGCADKQKTQELETANRSLRAETGKLREQLGEMSNRLAQTQQELERAQAQVAAQRVDVSRLQAQNREVDARLAELTAPPPAPVAPVQLPVSHEQFKAKVTGMTHDQLTGFLGKPVDTSTNGSREYWDYEGVAFDSVTGKPDRRVQVLFTNGRVDGAVFIP